MVEGDAGRRIEGDSRRDDRADMGRSGAAPLHVLRRADEVAVRAAPEILRCARDDKWVGLDHA